MWGLFEGLRSEVTSVLLLLLLLLGWLLEGPRFGGVCLIFGPVDPPFVELYHLSDSLILHTLLCHGVPLLREHVLLPGLAEVEGHLLALLLGIVDLGGHERRRLGLLEGLQSKVASMLLL